MVLPCLCIFAPVIGKFYGYATVNICRVGRVKRMTSREIGDALYICSFFKRKDL